MRRPAIIQTGSEEDQTVSEDNTLEANTCWVHWLTMETNTKETNTKVQT